MHRRRLAIVLFLALAAVGVGQEKTYDLRWKPKETQSVAYKLTMTAVVESAPLTISGDLLLKVLKVAPNGDYTIESRFKNGKVTYKGVDQLMDEDDAPEVQTFSARGELLTPSKDDPGEDALGYVLGQVADFTQPEKPVKVGDKWEKTAQGSGKSPPARSTYELVGRQKVGDVDALKVKYAFRQTEGVNPVTADGAFNLDPADGMMVLFEASISNLPFDKDLPPTLAKLRLERAGGKE